MSLNPIQVNFLTTPPGCNQNRGFLTNLYSHLISVVRGKGVNIKPNCIGRGVKQGDPVSHYYSVYLRIFSHVQWIMRVVDVIYRPIALAIVADIISTERAWSKLLRLLIDSALRQVYKLM